VTGLVDERLTVQVGAILLSGVGLTVFNATAGERGPVRVVGKGDAIKPMPGQVYLIEGRWHDSARRGRQFYAETARFRRVPPLGRLVGPWLQGIPGLGPVRAKRLAKTFGAKLGDALDGKVPLEAVAEAIDPDRPNLAAQLAALVVGEWQELRCEYGTIRWLEERGVEDVPTSRRIARLLGPEAVLLLERNPYVVAGVLGWTKLDPLAMQVLLSQDPARDVRDAAVRILGAIDVVMQDAVRQGHTAITKKSIGVRVAGKLGLEPSDELEARIVRIGMANGALVDGGDRWRCPGCAIMEEEVLTRFRRMGSGQEKGGLKLPAERDLRRLLAMVENTGRALHAEQRDAVLQVVTRPLACLTGGAGTGKTTTCRAIVELWETLGGHVQMAALSGKAALRLGEGTGRTGPDAKPPVTIHRLLLGLRKRSEGQSHWAGSGVGPSRELPQLTSRSLLVVDEASMVDLGQMHQILEVMPEGCRLLLVGDAFQLAPVGFGLVFHRLAAQDAVTSRLEKVHRQADASGIPAVSRIVRTCRVPSLPAYEPSKGGVSLLLAEEGELSEAVGRVVLDLGGHAGGAGGVMVLSAVNRRASRPDGTVQDLNERLHQAHVAGLGLTESERAASLLRGYNGNEFGPGDPVTFMRNCYERGLRNGSLGRVLSVDAEAGVMTCEFDGEPFTFGDRDLIDLQLAHAVSCHRAQGSQARVVVVSLLDAPNVDPTWVYTALTRAEETAVIVGSPENLTRVFALPPLHDRRLIGCNFDLSEPSTGALTTPSP